MANFTLDFKSILTKEQKKSSLINEDFLLFISNEIYSTNKITLLFFISMVPELICNVKILASSA